MAKRTLDPAPSSDNNTWKLAGYVHKEAGRTIDEPVLISMFTKAPVSLNGKEVHTKSGKTIFPPTPSEMKSIYDSDPAYSHLFIPPSGYKAPWEKQ